MIYLNLKVFLVSEVEGKFGSVHYTKNYQEYQLEEGKFQYVYLPVRARLKQGSDGSSDSECRITDPVNM